MSLMKKHAIVAILVISLLCTGCTQEAGPAREATPEQVTIKFGGLQGVPNIAQRVAQDLGYYEEAGITFEHYYLDPGTHAPSLVAGDVDVALMSPTALAMAIEGGTPIKGISLVAYGEPWRNAGVIAALNKSGIRKVEGLKGKKIAVSYPGDVDHIYLLEILREAGIEKDVELTFMLWPLHVGALVNGDVDAVQMIPYYTAVMDLEGIDYVVVEKPEGTSVRRDVAVLAASNAALSDPQRREALRRFLMPYCRAQRHLEQNPEIHTEYLVEYAGWKPEVAGHLKEQGKIISLAEDGRFDRKSVEELMGLMVEAGFLNEELPVESFMTEELLPVM